MPGTGLRKDPFGNFNFKVEIDGIIRAGFHDVSGLDSTIDVHPFREGGENTTMRKLPMLTKFSDIVLKWGATDDHELYDWHRQAVIGNVQRKNGSILVLDRQGSEKLRWNFFNAWPTKYDAPTLNAESTDVAIETLTLAHEGLERVQ
jgi:phage tail-like protein